MDFATQYKLAANRDNEVRDAAFLELNERICGIELRQMTPRDFLILDGLDNPILYGGEPDWQQLAVFVWLMSADWRPGRWAAFWFGRRIRKMNFKLLRDAAAAYIEDAFQDAPGGSSSPGETFNSIGASLVHRIGKAYSWTWRETLNTPFKILFQQIKCLHMDEGKQDSRSRRLLKVCGDRLRRLNAERVKN